MQFLHAFSSIYEHYSFDPSFRPICRAHQFILVYGEYSYKCTVFSTNILKLRWQVCLRFCNFDTRKDIVQRRVNHSSRFYFIASDFVFELWTLNEYYYKHTFDEESASEFCLNKYYHIILTNLRFTFRDMSFRTINKKMLMAEVIIF